MNRFGRGRVVGVAAVVAAFVVSIGGHGVATAQDATPAPAPIVDTVLGQGMPDDAPGKVLTLERYTLAPGASIPMHVHSGAYVISVDSGEFGFTVVTGTAEITRASATTPETIAQGVEVIAYPGDVIFEQLGVVHTARNAGETPVVIYTASLLIAGQPGLQPSNAEGTPAA